MDTVTMLLIITVIVGIITTIVGHLSDKSWIETLGMIASLLGGISLAAYTLCLYLSRFQ